MADFKYEDLQWRKITQTAYDSQKQAGTDVSSYKPIQPTVAPAASISPVTPTAAPVTAPSQLDAIKQLPQYNDLLKKWYKAEDIEKAVAWYKPPQPQVQPQSVVQPATQQTPAEQTTATPVKPVETTPQKDMNKTGTMELLPVSEYQDNSSDRMNQIVSNLNQYRQNAPQFMGDINTFRDNFNYAWRSPEQQKTLDTWYGGYKKWVELSTTPTTDLVDKFTNWQVTATDLEQLKMNDPNKYAEVMQWVEKKKVFENLKGELYWVEEKKTIMQQVEEPIGTNTFFDEYKKAINSEEVKWMQTEIASKQWQIKQLQLDMQTIANDVEKQYEWTGASRSKINAIIADQQEEIGNKISALSIDTDTVLNRYNSIVSTAKETMQMGLQQQESEIAQRNQKMKELWFYYEYDPKWMTERADTLFQIENPDINSSDPMTARRALNTELAKYYEQFGDIIIRPQSQALNDILAQAKAEWLSLSQALKKNFTDPLQAKNLYSAKLQKNMGLDFWDYQLTQSADWNWNMTSKAQEWERKIEIDENGNRKVVQSWTWTLPALDYGTGTVTNYGFRNWKATDYGIDYDTEIWTELKAPYSWTIQEVWTMKDWNVYANLITNDWTLIQFNHLDKSTLNQIKSWTIVNAWDLIWIAGNSWYVLDMKWNVPTAQQKAQWVGSHVDIRIKKNDWTYITGKDAQAYLSWWGAWWIDTKTAFSLLSFPTAVKSDQEQQNIKDLVASWNIPAVKSKLINLAVNNIEWAESKKDYQSTNQMIWTLDKIQWLLDKANELWVPTWWLSWKSEDLVNKFGRSNNPEIVRLGTALKDQLDALRRWRSWAALTEFEEQFYDSIFPSTWKRYNLNTANINWLKDSRKMIFRTYLENAYTSEIADQIIWQTTTTTPTPPSWPAKINYSAFGQWAWTIAPAVPTARSLIK